MDPVTEILILYALSMGVMFWLLVRVLERDRKEREALYNRLMSRDYREFVTGQQTSTKPPYVNPIQKSISDHRSRLYAEDDDFE